MAGVKGQEGDIVIPVYLSITMLDEVIVNAQQKAKISVDYFDMVACEVKNTEMYVDGFKTKLEKDTSYKGM